jgi:FixJ family two-component response regulator
VSTAAPTVFVVDDEAPVCVALTRLIRAAGFQVETFGSASALLRVLPETQADCLVVDVHLPDMTGLELQKKLAELGIRQPIVFITGRGDIPMSVRAMKAGAVEFLTKPFDDQELLTAIRQGIERQHAVRQHEAELRMLRQRYASLTPRERQVFSLVVAGLLNKQIAGELGAAEKTIKIHRGNLMRKMGAGSLPDLVRMAEKLSREPSA